MGALVLGYTVDALFEAEKVIVELDSWEFHNGAIAFETDRERDAETLARGYRTVRITWERIHARPRDEARRLRKILAAQAPKAA
jgi:very-short-patch-repair endonuclease